MHERGRLTLLGWSESAVREIGSKSQRGAAVLLGDPAVSKTGMSERGREAASTAGEG